MFKFLHLGDVHLDTRFLCRRPALREELRVAIQAAFSRAVDFAIDEELDAVLIAGDLFDSERLSYRTESFIVNEIKRLDARGITTVYVAGNHDPGGGGFRAVAKDVAPRFHYVARNEVAAIEILGRSGEPVARVLGAGHATARDAVNLARRFPPASNGIPHVGLLHTMVAGARDAEGHERYAPCTLEDLRRPGYRYWALGHIHVRQQVCDQSHAYYCGNLQGRNPRETGAKGGLLVQIDGPSTPDITFRSFAPIVWRRAELSDLDDVDTLRDLISRAQSRLASESEGESGEIADASGLILRLVLRGSTPLFERLSTDEQRSELGNELAEALGALDVEVQTHAISPPLDLAEHRGQPHLLGEVLAMLEELEADPEALDALIPDPLAGYAGRDEAELRTYARSLLSGLDREAALRLLISGRA